MSDPNDDPILNCILEVCCLASSDQQHATMANLLVRDCGCAPDVAATVGRYILSKFDLAEKGTLAPFKASIVRVHKARPAGA